MTTETNPHTDRLDGGHTMKINGLLSGIYGTATIGAAIYFIQHASTLLEGVLGIGKAIVWPGLVIYKLLEFLKM